MTDVAPALLEAITDKVTQGIEGSSNIQSVLALIQNKKATHADSLFYAKEMGEILARAFKTNLSSAVLPDGRMYYNIAKRILEPTLTNNHNLIADVATEVQSILNEQASIGLKAVRPAVNQSGIDSIVNKVSQDMPFDNVSWMLQDPIVRFSEQVVDETIQENVDFIGESGVATTITRTAESGACEWCRAVAGTYTYPNIPDDVYRRHDNCHCLIVSKTDKTKKVIHSGKEGDRKYVKGKISGKYQLTQDERIKILKENEATAEARAKAARQKRIETWKRKKQG